MAERLNCVQNAVTIRNQVLIRNKVAGFIIVGGQDNIQAVAGHLLGFFAELGFIFPQFPYIALRALMARMFKKIMGKPPGHYAVVYGRERETGGRYRLENRAMLL